MQSILYINGNYFTFETNGGMQGIPSLSGVTGDGGIFVDSNGTIAMSPNIRSSWSNGYRKAAMALLIYPKRKHSLRTP